MKRDTGASSFIMDYCAQRPLGHILGLRTTQEQWDKQKSLYATLGFYQLEAKSTASVKYEPRQNASIADISDELTTLESKIGTINEATRPHQSLKLYLQLGLTNITNFEAVVTQLMEYERKLSVNDKTNKENVFTATANRGRNSFKEKSIDEHDKRGRKKGSGGNCFNCGKIGHCKAD